MSNDFDEILIQKQIELNRKLNEKELKNYKFHEDLAEVLTDTLTFYVVGKSETEGIEVSLECLKDIIKQRSKKRRSEKELYVEILKKCFSASEKFKKDYESYINKKKGVINDNTE